MIAPLSVEIGSYALAHIAPFNFPTHANLILTTDINVKALVKGDRVFLVHCSLQLATKLYNDTKRFRKTNSRSNWSVR